MSNDGININPDQIAKQLSDRGQDWADKEAAAQALEESRRRLRSQLAVRFIEDGYPANKAEMMAESEQEYGEHINAMVEARKEANKAKVSYEAMRVYTELKRTQSATERALAQLQQ